MSSYEISGAAQNVVQADRVLGGVHFHQHAGPDRPDRVVSGALPESRTGSAARSTPARTRPCSCSTT
ncbi:hypothetical protein UO65_2448 [Actinokineospora spheciospongiae]|uniref:Uncharacterized protein n=1 Tax=Actinokineospora spheciospongiae TaxID=909613 RepID=W7J8C7_9PSEU|nr:hypothetical protein [Actinokineospora spheciospongiae]EWC62269.1 hypothetical protein UO65_2448 [Actinokineospora spheciospongiae]